MSKVAEILRQAREANGLTINQVAEITKIRADHLQAIERGNFEIFDAPIYARGFVRSYAMLLKLDVPQVMSELEKELNQIAKFKESASLTGEPKGFVDWLMFQLSKINWSIVAPVIGLILIIFILTQVYRAWHRYSSRDIFSEINTSAYEPNQERYELYLPIPTNSPQ
ncbi:MAG: helix-turn-helix domain-containing protein [Verrucomicrobiia bacterium]